MSKQHLCSFPAAISWAGQARGKHVPHHPRRAQLALMVEGTVLDTDSSGQPLPSQSLLSSGDKGHVHVKAQLKGSERGLQGCPADLK